VPLPFAPKGALVNYIDEAIKIAKRSDIRKHKTGAILIRNEKIISNGWSHVPHYKVRGRSLHAEMHALARARHLNLNSTECVVFTLSAAGNRVSGKPCLHCAIALRAAGITTVTYSHPYFGWASLDLFDESTFDDLKVYERNSH
jgi:deoxycytidylate deaminase